MNASGVDWELLRELAAKLEQNQLTNLSASELEYLRSTCVGLGYQPAEVAARTSAQGDAFELLRDARERVRSGSRRLMAAIATASPELLAACLTDPVEHYRTLAARELARLADEEDE